MRRIVAVLAAVVLLIPVTGSSLAATKPPAPTCVPPAAGLTGWWSGDKTTSDGWGDNDARLVGGAAYGKGYVDRAFALNGTSAFVDVPDAPALNPTSGVMTLSLWVKFNSTAGEQVIAEKWVQVFDGPSTGWTLTKHDDNRIGFYSTVGGLHSDPLPLVLGRWYHVAVRLDGSTITLFLNGVVIGQQGMDASQALSLGTASSLKFGHRGNPSDTPGSQSDQQFFLNGSIDEVQFWNNAALSDDQVRSIVAADTAGTCGKGGPTARTLQLGNNLALDHPSLVATLNMPDNKIGSAVGTELPPFPPESLYPVGFRWIRTSFSDDVLNWQNVEVSAGVYFVDSDADAAISSYAAHGLTIVMCLGVGSGEGVVDPTGLHDPAELARYAEYVRYMVRHFKDRVGYFELWNEPGDIAPDDYIRMVHYVLPIIRAEAPAAKVVIGAIHGGWEWGYPGYGAWGRFTLATDYLFRLLDSDLMPLVDAISWHPMYGDRADDSYYQTYPELVAQIKAEARAHGFRGEYIAEEMCWRSNADTNVPVEPRIEGALAEKYMVRTMVTHRGFGLVTVIAPSAYDWTAIQNTNIVLAGAQPTSIPVGVMTTATHVRQYAFSLPNGDRLVALWNDWLPLDEDPGVPATVMIGAKGSAVTAIDPLHGTSQRMMTFASGGGTVIKGLLIKDYPVFLRISGK
jgi:hypothetical protein